MDQIHDISDNLIYLNSQIVLWKYSNNFTDEEFRDTFNHRFENKYIVYNLLERKINFEKDFDKIIDFVDSSLPIYPLEFILTFSISAKNWLSLDPFNILIVHDELNSVISFI